MNPDHALDDDSLSRSQQVQIDIICELRSLIEDRRPSHHDSAQLVTTIAEALHYAQHQRIVHRDIKPIVSVDGHNQALTSPSQATEDLVSCKVFRGDDGTL